MEPEEARKEMTRLTPAYSGKPGWGPMSHMATMYTALTALQHTVTFFLLPLKIFSRSGVSQELARAEEPFSSLDAGRWLAEVERMEQEEGTQFVNIRKKDTAKRYIGPVVAALVSVVLMAGIIGLILWVIALDPAGAPPLWLLLLLMAIPAAVIVGVLLALWQRVKQIQGGEEDAASKY